MIVTLSGTPLIKARRVYLRAPEARDAEGYAAFMSSDRSHFVGGPLTEIGRPWRSFATIVGHWAIRGFGLFTVVRADTDSAIGMAGPWFPEGWPEQELGWSLWSAADEGQGFATEAVSAARDFAFDRLGWTTAVSYIDAANAPSMAVARRLGAHLDEAAAAPPADGKTVQVWRHTPATRSVQEARP